MPKSTGVCQHQRDNTHDERCQLEENELQMKNLWIDREQSRCTVYSKSNLTSWIGVVTTSIGWRECLKIWANWLRFTLDEIALNNLFIRGKNRIFFVFCMTVSRLKLKFFECGIEEMERSDHHNELFADTKLTRNASSWTVCSRRNPVKPQYLLSWRLLSMLITKGNISIERFDSNQLMTYIENRRREDQWKRYSRDASADDLSFISTNQTCDLFLEILQKIAVNYMTDKQDMNSPMNSIRSKSDVPCMNLEKNGLSIFISVNQSSWG